jgi:hypothetical protein
VNKAFYITGIVLSVIFFFLIALYAEETSSARYSDYYSYSSYSDYNSYNSYRSYGSSASEYTTEAALWSILFFLFFVATDILGLIKIKTKTTKVLSIIGLSISFIFLLWNFGVLSSPSSMSFDEVAPAWILYSFIFLAFSIIGLVQSVKYGASKKAPLQSSKSSIGSKDLLDTE